VNDATDLDSLLIAGHVADEGRARRPGRGRSGPRVVGKLLAGFLVGTATAASAVGGTMALAHTVLTRSVDTVFVTPDAPVLSHPEAAPGEAAPGDVVPSGPDPRASDEGYGRPPAAGQHLDDGLSEDHPGQPAQPEVPQDPHSNG
jgi:hypothetical protein